MATRFMKAEDIELAFREKLPDSEGKQSRVLISGITIKKCQLFDVIRGFLKP